MNIVIGSDAGGIIYIPGRGFVRVPGWEPGPFAELTSALNIIRYASRLKTPGLGEKTAEVLTEFVQKELGTHLKEGGVLVVVVTTCILTRGGAVSLSPEDRGDEQRYVAWFHELDSWTEYWDIYHPETRGHYYFGDGDKERGLLTQFLPRDRCPPAYVAWTRMALLLDSSSLFSDEVRILNVASAVIEVDELVARLFAKHFGDAADPHVQADYLEAISRFATDSLPPAIERVARISDDDPRKRTAGRHTLDGDLMWFAWALQLEAGYAIAGIDDRHPLRSLLMAGVATGCPANFAWRGHRRTRVEYLPDARTASLLRERGMRWASDFEAAVNEIHALYRIREWGHDE